MSRWHYPAIAAMLLLLGMIMFNAWFFAPTPKGTARLIAHRGVHQLVDPQGAGAEDCTAQRLLPSDHDVLGNSVRSMTQAVGFGASMVSVDVATTSDGGIMLFEDKDLDCRTNGKGPVRGSSMAALQALDIGYGYTADGGKSFPLRGKGVGAMPTLEDAVAALPRHRLLFHLDGKDADAADRLLGRLKAAGRDPASLRDGFYGDAAAVARVRKLAPDVWAWTEAEAAACSKAYIATGWFGHVPEQCRGRTILVPLNYQWLFWGWPDRFLARMDAAKVEVILTASYDGNDPLRGLNHVEQIGSIPRQYNGWIWVENIRDIGPSIKR